MTEQRPSASASHAAPSAPPATAHDDAGPAAHDATAHDAGPAPTPRTRSRVRASSLVGRRWLNTGGADLSLEELRGKVVILDFWTFACINCLHVADELRPLEREFADVLVTVGVHSPKFEHEAEPAALEAAVERYGIAHPVLDDPALTTWQAYSARAWPTLVVVDPEGYIVAHLSGEGHVAGLYSLVRELVAEHEAKGTLHRGSGPYVPPAPVARDFKFPGTAIALEGRGTEPGSFLVADTGHHRLVELAADLTTVLGAVGGGDPALAPGQASGQAPEQAAGLTAPTPGTRGHRDGGPAEALFNEPNGLLLLPEDVAAQVGYDVVVADTVNHRLRGVTLATGEVRTLAGNGVQALIDSDRVRAAAGSEDVVAADLSDLDADPLQTSLSSPWDLAWDARSARMIVAMAGTHQLFSFDPLRRVLAVWAGTGLEGLLDGPAETAWFAQTSGLSFADDGTLWLADSETSAVRWVREDGDARTVGTAVGTGLFDFGHVDGDPARALMQHPLGVTALPDGSVLVADTFNGAVRRVAPEGVDAAGRPVPAVVSTVARGLAEPADVLVEPGEDGTPKDIVVVETNAHRLVRIAVPEEYLTVDEGARQTQRPRTDVVAGELELVVGFAAPSGQKLDERWGDPTQMKVSSSPEELLLEGAGTSVGLRRTLRLNPEVAEGVLHITARAAACDGEPGRPIPDSAACHLYQQDWGIPVSVHAPDQAPEGAETRLDLDLRGIH
ncbi:NHL domain-containing thioredoxin family protein [Micrococcus sp.]|uniref:NHL domain-containing thioredoxin family protein n=1 Tax=Micrococcus sp. TaxID=1271 RepID=UPI002A91E60A|nr:NHL domain-containing thioredoxin family protein [Micrococcus sp.]MDY6054888.1 NHL domain-containing thioredoxin family protein [Micrococcus sp.]